ncbi:MAG TPA: DUF2252 family protein [Myxococcaceae bacterium]|nr:DUF2252 family protein [Myxococcaceae bacterium]
MSDASRKLRPFELARWQLERDRTRMRRLPLLLARKQARMSASPFAFLRGSAPLFYRILRNAPRLARGPDDEGLLCGDLHLENFGAYRPDRPSPRGDRVVFDLNDLDEAFFGPLHLDLLRVLTSVLLAARSWGCTVSGALELAGELLDGYRRTRASGRLPPPPRPVTELLALVAARKRRELLDRRTRTVHGHRRFQLGETLLPLPRSIRTACARGFTRFAREEIARAGHPPERFRVLDVAFRVAGTGSLGTFRVAVLVEGHGAPHGAWMFDMKGMGESAGTAFATRPAEPGPDRVVHALRTLLRHPPTMLGAVRVLGHGLLVRRLTPQEDRLDWETLSETQRAPTLGFLGALTAAAHRRGARAKLRRLEGRQGRRLLRSAAELAGLHEAAALAYVAEGPNI